jgi:type IV pilus assembly protein PilZ
MSKVTTQIRPPITQPITPAASVAGNPTAPSSALASVTAPILGAQVTRPPGARPGMLNVTIKDKPTLYSVYMPFIKNGGLFIPIPSDFKKNNDFEMGNEVFILLTLMDERIPVAGKVVWLTPEHAEGNRLPGFGIQFNDLEGIANKKIEALLAGSQELGRPTQTM